LNYVCLVNTRQDAAEHAAEAQRLEELRQQQAAQPSALELQAEADAKGYGRLYAVFGGGREGLEACAASAFTLCFKAHFLCVLPCLEAAARR